MHSQIDMGIAGVLFGRLSRGYQVDQTVESHLSNPLTQPFSSGALVALARLGNIDEYLGAAQIQ